MSRSPFRIVFRGLAASTVAGCALLLGAAGAAAQPLPRIIYERPGARADSIDFSADGRFLVTGGLLDQNPYPNGQIRYWRAARGILLNEITLNDQLGYTNEVQFSPTGDRVVSANGTVDCYPNGGCFAYKPGQFVSSFPEAQQVGGGPWPHLVAGVDYSPAGDMIATAEYYTSQAVNIYDPAFILIRTLPGHAGGSYAVRFSPNGELLASGGEDGKVKIWRVADGALLRQMGDDLADVKSLNFSPNGDFVAVGYFGYDITVRVWRVEDSQLLYTIPADPYASSSTALFTPDGEYFAAATTTYASGEGWFGLIRFWCASNGQLVKEYKDDRIWDAGIGGFAIAPDDSVFAYGYAGRLILARRPVLPACP